MQNHVDKKTSTPDKDSQSNREKPQTTELSDFTFTSSIGVNLLQRAVQNPNAQTLTPAVVQRLQRQYGNRFVTRLVQRIIAPASSPSVHHGDEEEPHSTMGDATPHSTPISSESPIQRRYKYAGKVPGPPPTSIPMDIWQDAANKPYTLNNAVPSSAGVDLTFNPAIAPEPPQIFTVPAEINDKKFAIATPDNVQYVNPANTSEVLNVQDLNLFTGYTAASARSAFTPMAEDDHQPQFHRTSFLGRVGLVPIKSTQGNELFKASEIWVQDVKIPDERPPTKFGKEGQRSHTVAWLLLRAALQGLANQPLNTFLKILQKMLKDVDLPTISDDAQSAAQALYTKIQTGIDQIGDGNKAAELFFWQRLASDFIGQYVHFYQLSESATYADGRAIGHGESGHMATLRDAESALKLGNTFSTERLEEITAAAVGLTDVKSRLSAKIRAQVYHHWVNNLYLAFPTLMKKHHTDIIAELGLSTQDSSDLQKAMGKDPTQPLSSISKKPTTQSIESDRNIEETALLKANQSTFTANVFVVPQTSVPRRNLGLDGKEDGFSTGKTTLALGHYKAAELKIEQLEVADDRPNTRFGILQRSHTVAWTLVRRHLINFSGKSAITLLNFIANELPILQADIPGKGKRIPYDAPAEASRLHTNVTQIAVNADGFPLHQWQMRLSELVESYVTLYQLSRSATYSKEENPKGHGESTAIGYLDKIELELAEIPDILEQKKYIEPQLREICVQANKLVDAVVATRSLEPEQWRTAIEHWLKLLAGKYPTLMNIPEAATPIRESITVAEPEDTLLAGYQNPKRMSARDKLLITLYENARNEARSAPADLIADTKTSLRLWLAQLPAPKEKGNEWSKIVLSISLKDTNIKAEKAAINQYFKNPNRRDPPKPVPDKAAIDMVINDVKKFFGNVKNNKAGFVKILLNYITSQSEKHTEVQTFVTTNAPAIKEKIEGAFDEALELSKTASMENYQAWYHLIHQLGVRDQVNYQNLMGVIEAESKKKQKSEATKVEAGMMVESTDPEADSTVDATKVKHKEVKSKAKKRKGEATEESSRGKKRKAKDNTLKSPRKKRKTETDD